MSVSAHPAGFGNGSGREMVLHKVMIGLRHRFKSAVHEPRATQILTFPKTPH